MSFESPLLTKTFEPRATGAASGTSAEPALPALITAIREHESRARGQILALRPHDVILYLQLRSVFGEL
jgi:hypothetical protein